MFTESDVIIITSFIITTVAINSIKMNSLLTLPDLCRLKELNSTDHLPCHDHDEPPNNVQNISSGNTMLELQGNQAYERSLPRLCPAKPTIQTYEIIPPLPRKGAFKLETLEEGQEPKATML